MARVEYYLGEEWEPEEAVRLAMDDCLRDGVMEDVLTKFGNEVYDMFLTEYDEKAHLRNTYAEGIEEGMEKGIEKGIEEGMEKGIEKGIEEGMEKGIEKGIEVGMEKGIEVGIEKGGAKKSKEVILYLLEEKGTVTEECRKTILAQTDGKILDEWFKKAVKAVSVEDFMEQIK